MEKETLKSLLKDKGLRATKNRLDVLAFLEKQEHPVGIDVIAKKFSTINQVTLYRMAADFVQHGLWHEIDLGHGHADYESTSKPHHHHAVCESCGLIEEVYGCQKECQLLKSVRNQASKFDSLKSPNASLVGTCKSCAVAK